MKRCLEIHHKINETFKASIHNFFGGGGGGGGGGLLLLFFSLLPVAFKRAFEKATYTVTGQVRCHHQND